jgi:hypothetical protein
MTPEQEAKLDRLIDLLEQLVRLAKSVTDGNGNVNIR